MAYGDKNDDDQIHKDAIERFTESIEGSDFNREAYYSDVKFSRMGDQWDKEVKKLRVQEGRPALTINKLPAFIRSIVNESRQNRPAIQVTPSDNFGDEETAQVIGGLIKSIERRSSAEVAYSTALDCAVTGGFGFWRVDIDYVNDESFSLEARINRIPNPLSVHWDTASTRFDASDWEYAFVSDWMEKDEYEVKYPDASMSNFEGDSRDEASDQWIREDSIRIAEYFCKKPDSYQLMLLAMTDPQTGEVQAQTVREQDLETMAARFFENQQIDLGGMVGDDALIQMFMQQSGTELRQTREVDTHKIMRYIMNGDEVLESDPWPGKKIPICPVWGEEVFVDGRRHFRSMVRDAKDSQQMFNFWRSASTELVALAPKTPFIGPKGFIPKGDETKWASANTRSHAYLEYNATAGNMPQRQPFAGVPAGVLQEAANNVDDMKSIMGIFDSSLGARSNETSGRAIMARERQGDVSNFHFLDNMSRAISYCGEVLVDIIPSVYSAEESIRILGEDDKAEVAKLTQEAGGSQKKGLNGQPALYNLSVGVYDINVKSGPSFATAREETRETLIEIMRQVPDAAPFVGDVLLDHMDFVGADIVAKRLKHLLPPEIKQAEDAESNSDNPEMAAMQQQLQAKDQEMEQAKQQVMQEIERLTKENEMAKQDNQAQMMKADSDAKKNQADAMSKGEELRLKEMELELKAQEQATKTSAQEQAQLDMLAKAADQEFQAQENAKDRQVELAKVFVSHQEYSMDQEQSTADALLKAAEAIAAPKELIRDEDGNVTGSRTTM
tara:strand:+ start:1310 stop:3664 length:2355 start_codon:yes stop_codon:yes gene_type:complete